MKLRLSKFYTRFYTIFFSIIGALAIVCLILIPIFKDLAALFIVLFAMFFVTFAGIYFNLRMNGRSIFHRSQLCKGGICEFSSNGKRKIKAISWKNVAYVIVVSDYMTSQKWICFSKKRLSSSEMQNPLKYNSKADYFVLYPYSERAYEVALQEVKKHREASLGNSNE